MPILGVLLFCINFRVSLLISPSFLGLLLTTVSVPIIFISLPPSLGSLTFQFSSFLTSTPTILITSVALWVISLGNVKPSPFYFQDADGWWQISSKQELCSHLKSPRVAQHNSFPHFCLFVCWLVGGSFGCTESSFQCMGFSLVVTHRGFSTAAHRLLLLWSRGSGCVVLVVSACACSCSVAQICYGCMCSIAYISTAGSILDQGSTSHPLHWKADSQWLGHQVSPNPLPFPPPSSIFPPLSPFPCRHYIF